MKSSELRASARSEEPCKEDSEFGRRAALVDHLELIGGRMVGGPTQYLECETRAAEAEVLSIEPKTAADFRWLMRRVARAVENDWRPEALRPLLKSAG
jgi:hypothetical protein